VPYPLAPGGTRGAEESAAGTAEYKSVA
jgi:hypothetical protein